MPVTILTSNADETMQFGAWLGQRAFSGLVVGLSGDLGAGKTTLVKGVARGLGVDPASVTSPTFTFLHVYPGRIPVYHLDLYRLDSVPQVRDLGVDEYVGGDGVALVEWFENVPGWLPSPRLEIRIAVLDADKRRLEITSVGEGLSKLVEEAASWR